MLIVLLTVLALLGLYWLPDIQIGDWQMRRIDLLADIRPANSDDKESIDSLVSAALTADRPHAIADSCPEGITCIDDMCDSLHQGITPLYEALTNVKNIGRPVRIAVLGDSYIEGDIFTADLRQMLQQHYGGCGVGFVPASSENPGFRRSVLHTFSGWTEHSANNPQSSYSSNWANLTGRYFNAAPGAWVELKGVTKYLSLLDSCTTSSLYFAGTGSVGASARINGDSEQYFDNHVDDGVQVATVKGRIGRVRWHINHHSGRLVYLGASMESEQGVVVDNFALRSASGLHLKSISEKMLSDLDQVRHYDLVIIMYGLNVASKKKSEYSSYRENMTQAINHMKAAMPHTGFLVVSVGDREQKYGSSYRTMRGVLSLINTQQLIAFDTRTSFWNLYTAMGGEGSIVRMVDNHEANLDYTHINFRGGRRLAKLLFDAIVWGQESYARQQSANS